MNLVFMEYQFQNHFVTIPITIDVYSKDARLELCYSIYFDLMQMLERFLALVFVALLFFTWYLVDWLFFLKN